MSRKRTGAIKEIKTLSDLTPDDLNANAGTVRGRAMLEDSVAEHGALEGIVVDARGNIAGGNKRTEVFVEKGLVEPIVVRTDGTRPVVIQRTDLDKERDPAGFRRAGVMLNRAAEASLNWDAEALKQIQASGVSLSGAFHESELHKIYDAAAASEASLLAAQAAVASAPLEFPVLDETISTEHRCPKCGYEWSGKRK
jgi:hypothetical protein